MRAVFMLMVFHLIWSNYCFSQEIIPPFDDIVPTTYISPDYPTSPTDHCFDIEYVKENCVPIYINVNVHFFLNDSCTGHLATGPGVSVDLNPENAFALAEQLIDEANSFFEIMSSNSNGYNYQWNASAHGAVTTSAQCVPLRYVLTGVYIHCDTEAQTTTEYFSQGFNDYYKYFVNGGSEINIFVADITTSANGYSAINYNGIVTENFRAGLLNHEMGHALKLEHTHLSGDDCDDTWAYNWKWYKSCDSSLVETGYYCWNNEPLQSDGFDPCDTTKFCNPHPCCDWTNQNNNLMTYSAWAGNPEFSALTPCQIGIMLTNLAEYKCNFIKVGGCPPPSAFVGTKPQSSLSTKCERCFYLNGSYNESGYEMDIYRPDSTKIISTGEVFTEAGKFCISPKYDKFGNPYWPNGFQSGIEYTLKLRVFNGCGDSDQTEYKFTLPPLCSEIEPLPDTVRFVVESIAPNPTTSYITVKYSTREAGQLKVYGTNLNTLTNYGVLRNTPEMVGDDQQFTIDVSNWVNGVNTLIFEYKGEIIIENVIKN